MKDKRKIIPLSKRDLIKNKSYLLVREGKMKSHTGVYVFEDIFDIGQYVLYSKKLKIHYTIPFIPLDIKLYEI